MFHLDTCLHHQVRTLYSSVHCNTVHSCTAAASPWHLSVPPGENHVQVSTVQYTAVQYIQVQLNTAVAPHWHLSAPPGENSVQFSTLKYSCIHQLLHPDTCLHYDVRTLCKSLQFSTLQYTYVQLNTAAALPWNLSALQVGTVEYTAVRYT